MNWLAASGLNGIRSRRFNAGWKARSSGKRISRSEAHLIPNPIRKVLFSMRAHRVRALLMGGQACVFYGAAEFIRSEKAKSQLLMNWSGRWKTPTSFGFML